MSSSEWSRSASLQCWIAREGTERGRSAVWRDVDDDLAGGGRPVVENFAWILSGRVVYAAGQWVMLAGLAKLTNPSTVGQFALGVAVAAPAFQLGNLQLRGVQATDAQDEYTFGEYLGLRLVTTPVALLFIGAIALVGYAPATGAVILLVGLSKAAESLSDVHHGLMQKHERLDPIGQSLIVKSVVSTAAFLGLLAATGSLVWALWGLVASWSLVLVWFDIPRARSIAAGVGPAQSMGPSWSPGRLTALARLALPLGITMMLISLMTNVPRYVIEADLGEGPLGIFAALSYVVVAGTTVVYALGEAATPRLARLFVDPSEGSFGGLVIRMLVVGAIAGGAGIFIAHLWGRELLSLLYTDEYGSYEALFVWIMAAGAASYCASIFGFAMTAARRFRVQVPLFALVLAVTTAGCWILVPSYGLVGAAWALTAAGLVQMVGSGGVVWWALRNR
ncbi:MAG: lipopolysaccharide biosynthesis protein [Gemmatimonadetes bacterium]|nr:lipopolysaccharide biosynthesis protein [Gemmatimonadota bacterium]